LRGLLILLGVALAGLLVMTSIDTFVRHMVYPAPPVPVPSPPPAGLIEVRLHAGGEPVWAWWQPPPRAGAPVVLMLHGNGENLETMRQGGLFGAFARLGAGVLAIAYPGYGRSGGTPGESTNVAAAAAAWDWLRAHAAGSPCVLAGWSLGAAVAAQLAARRPGEPVALVLLSGWNRLPDVAGIHFPQWIVEATLPERYDSAAAVASVRCPSLVAHGERDDIIPVALGQQLFAALPEPKRWLAVPGAGHNDLLARGEVWRAIADLMQDVKAP
jgi:pimeloyl-ACP methyl ester carboxylesterase